MVAKKLTLSTAVPAAHSTPQAQEDDATVAAVRTEQTRYERRILDLEVAIRHERDRLRAEHLTAMREILGDEEAA